MPDEKPSSQSISMERFKEAVSAIVREELMQNKTVHIPELGTFRVQHQLSQIKEEENGDVVMIPPKDAVTFKPEQSE